MSIFIVGELLAAIFTTFEKYVIGSLKLLQNFN